MFPVAEPTRMVLCCTLLKDDVVHSLVFHMLMDESLLVLCAPSDKSYASGGCEVVASIDMLWEITVVMKKLWVNKH